MIQPQQNRGHISWDSIQKLISNQSSTWWRHQMEKFSALLALCAGNSPVTGEFPAQRPVTRGFDFYFVCAWTDGWVNNRDTGDLRCHCVHYDVTVMTYPPFWSISVCLGTMNHITITLHKNTMYYLLQTEYIKLYIIRTYIPQCTIL